MRLQIPESDDDGNGSNDLYVAHQEALNTGQLWIKFPCEWIRGSRQQRIDQIQTMTPREIKELVMEKQQEAELRRRLESQTGSDSTDVALYHPKEQMLPRRRLSSMGAQKCGIVLVDAQNAVNPISRELAEEQLYQHASTQFENCSNGALRLVKQDETVRIKLPRNIGTYDDTTISKALFDAVCSYYGYERDCNISRERNLDHILFSLPYGLSIDEPESFWAFASTGDYRRFSVYSGGTYGGSNLGFFVPSTIIHE